MIVAGTRPHLLFGFESAKSSIISKIRRTRYASKAGNVALGEALYFYRRRILRKGRRFSGKLIVVLASVDSNSGRSVSNQVSYLTAKGVTFLPVMVGYDVSQAFWKSRATAGKYVWVPKFSSLQFVVDAFIHMHIRWKMKMTMSSVLKCPKPVRYKTPCKHGFRKTMEIGFVKTLNKCNPITKVIKRKSCGCEKSQCFASQAMELILVMQASQDLGELHFGYEKQFIISMIQKMKIGAKSVRVSVVLFSSRASLAFRLTEYHSQSSVITAIKGLKLMTGKHRAIGDALLLVREQVLTDSAEQSAKMLIVITSGDSNYGRSVEVESNRLQEMSVSILVIGVGADVNDASLQVISTVYIHIRTWIKLKYAYKYVLRMRISFVAQPAVHGALKIRCPKYRRVLVSKCVAGYKKRIVKFYKMVRNTCMPFKQVHKVRCTNPPVCKEGTKVHIGKCNPKTRLRVVTRVHTSKIHDCSHKKCVWRCSKRLVRRKQPCRKIRCIKRRLMIEKRCRKSGFRRIFWGFYSTTRGSCKRVRIKVIRKVPCSGCSKHQIRIFHITVGRKCTGGSKAIYSSFYASHKGRCSYQRLHVTKRRCVLKKRCPRKARIQIETQCLRKGSRYRGVYWTYLTRLQPAGPCVRVHGKLVRLIPCGGCTTKQRSYQHVTTGKACKSGFITSFVTVYQGEESRRCHKTRVVIRKRNCKSCKKDTTKTTPCIRGYRRTIRIHFTVKGSKCVPHKTLIKKVKCGEEKHGCKPPRKVHTRCSAGHKYSYTTTYYYKKKKVCTGLVVPPSRTCSKVADLVFVLDSSTSIHDADFAKESRFVQHIVRRMGVSPTGVRVAVVTYSTRPKLVFNLDKYKTKSQVLAAMSKLPRDEGITMTYAAIDLVNSDIYPKRRAGVPFIVVVITDGKSTMGDPVASAKVLKKKGARFVSVGIYNPDPSVTDKINPAELKGISSKGRFWRAGNFNKLDSIVSSVVREVCTDMGKSKSKSGGKRVCKIICVKKRKISAKKICRKDCSSRTLIRHCKKHRAYRVFTRVTYRWNGKKCVPKSRKVIKKIRCPPRTCPKAKIIRKECKPGRAKSVTTHIFYTSRVKCTMSLPPRCTQHCIKKVKRSAVPCKKIKCKGDKDHVTKCGGSRRYRVVVTIKYIQVKGVCKRRKTTKRYPCPVKCPKTQTIIRPCKKGRKFSVKSIISYTVRRACVHKGKCTVKCVRRVLRSRKRCKTRPPDRRCKQPPPFWTKCRKHSAYKYQIKALYRNVRGTCVIYKRETIARLLCPPRKCPKTRVTKTKCTKGVRHKVTTTIFYSGKIVCSKKKPIVCRQVCTKRVTKSGVPCFHIVCDEAKKVKLTKCGGKRRYRSVITTWNTRVGKKCRKHRTVKHYPCPVVCPKRSKTIKRTSCGKGRKYRTLTIATSTVKKRCSGRICTLHCIRKLIHSRVLCPKPPHRCRKPRKVHVRCSKKNSHSYIITYYYVKKRVCHRALKSGKARRCKIVCVKKHKRSARKPCKKRKCRYQLSYHTTKCVHNFRTITTKYRTRVHGRCVWRRKSVRRVRCSGCSSHQIHYHKTTVGSKCKAGRTQTFLNFYESRKYKTGWVCHKKKVQVSIIKCKCNRKPLLLLDKKCRKGYRKLTKVVFIDRGGKCIRKQTVTKKKCKIIKIHCDPAMIVKKCTKHAAYRLFLQISYRLVDGKCRKHRTRIVKKQPCPPRRCPKAKTIRTKCKPGVVKRVTTHIFYTSHVRCTKSKRPRCTQHCIKKVKRSAVPCKKIKCKKDKDHVTKCGGSRRYRVVVTIKYTEVKGICKKHKTTKRYPCPIKCPKTQVIRKPCSKGKSHSLFEVKSIISYTVRRSCVHKGKCTAKCVRHVVSKKKPCPPVPTPCKVKAVLKRCKKHSAYKYLIEVYYKRIRGRCVPLKRITKKRLPCRGHAKCAFDAQPDTCKSSKGKAHCKTICVKKRKISAKKICRKDCSSRTLIRHCKKHRAYRVFTRVTYRWNGKKCVPKSRKVIKKIRCPPRTCPKAKIIRKECKPGRAKSVTTHIFYTSRVKCTMSLPPRCTQHCIKKVKRSAVPCKKIKCKGDKDHVTKCGGSRRYRVVVTIKYIQVKGVCKRRKTTKRYPCPVKCPKTQTIIRPCKKGRKFSVKSIISYTVRRACVHKGKCTVKCVRRVLRSRKRCKTRPPDRRCKQPPPFWTKCRKHSAYKYQIKALYRNVRGTCVIYKRETIARLLCPPRKCPKTRVTKTKCTKGVRHKVTTTIFYSGKIVCSKKKPIVCRQVCTKRVTKSGVPCFHIVCDEAKKVKLTKCGGKRRYRSVITTWNTRVGKKCRKHRTVKHYPCPVVCPKRSKTIKRTSCGKGRKYRTLTIATSTVKKRCSGRICTLHCIRKLIHSRVFVSEAATSLQEAAQGARPMLEEELTLVHHHLLLREEASVSPCFEVWKSAPLQDCVREEAQAVSQEAVCKKRKCRYQLSYHTTKCVHNFRTITTKYRTRVHGRCVWRRKSVRRVRCSGCSSHQIHYHKTTVGSKCKAGRTQTFLNFYESRKYKTGWVCHKKKVQVSIIKCKCNRKPLLLLDKKCRKGYRKLTKVVFIDRGGKCIRKQTVTKKKCKIIKIHCDPAMIVKKCTKHAAYRLFLQISYRLVDGKCRKHRTRIVKKQPCPPRRCPKAKTIRTKCKPGVVKRVTTHIFYTSHVRCTKSKRPRCTQHCIKKVKRSAVPCKKIKCKKDKDHVTKCGGSRRYRVVVTIKYTEVKGICKKHKTTKRYPCPIKCPKTQVIRKPCSKGKSHSLFEVKSIISY
uniref:VWFA domain-containing protein n=1 Tax=Macrostomum lignano TaxID=282301 RepID=A0A1I8H1S6_9PLAT